MVKRIFTFLSMGLFALGMAGCSSSGHAGSASVQTGPAEKLPEQIAEKSLLYHKKIQMSLRPSKVLPVKFQIRICLSVCMNNFIFKLSIAF